MQEIKALFKSASNDYNRLRDHENSTLDLVKVAHKKLLIDSIFRDYGPYVGKEKVIYSAFYVGKDASRPVRGDLYILSHEEFIDKFYTLRTNLERGAEDWSDSDKNLANSVVYTSVMAVACVYDLWQRGSR